MHRGVSGPDQRPVAVDDLRTGILPPQLRLRALSRAAWPGEQDALALRCHDVGAVQDQHSEVRQQIEQPRRL